MTYGKQALIGIRDAAWGSGPKCLQQTELTFGQFIGCHNSAYVTIGAALVAIGLLAVWLNGKGR